MFLKTDVISKVPFLRGASRPALTMLCTRMYPRVVGAGSNVISRGDIVQDCFIIENGEVIVERHDGNAPTTLRDGFFFGEFALLHGDWTSDITVRATRTTDLVVLPKDAMDEVLEQHPAFAVQSGELSTLEQEGALEQDGVFQNLLKVICHIKPKLTAQIYHIKPQLN